MKKTSSILCHVTQNQLGFEQITYEWNGKSPFIYISSSFPETKNLNSFSESIGKVFNIGPYRLKVLEFDVFTGYFYCVRQNYLFCYIVYVVHRFTKVLRVVKARFIITLAVWGLAKYDPANVPSWYDVYAIRKIKSWIK